MRVGSKMALFLVGINIDKHKAAYGESSGRLVQIMRGIYVDTSSDIDATILKHGFRIAKYLYKNARFIGYSAQKLAATPDGKIYISGARNSRVRLRSLEIIQTKTSASPSVQTAIIKDDLGEFTINTSSLRQQLFEAVRTRTEAASSISIDMKSQMITRYLSDFPDTQEAINNIWILGKENDWLKEANIIEGHIKSGFKLEELRNQAEFTLSIFWHKELVGKLNHNGIEWRYLPENSNGFSLIRQTTIGKLPPFISSLLPEGWLKDVLRAKDERELLQTNNRFMSNICILENAADIDQITEDVLGNRISNHKILDYFTGRYKGPGFDAISEEFSENLARYMKQSSAPKLSGVQIKIPMYLNDDGVLYPANNNPFTHILKPAGIGSYENMPLVEYYTMELARDIGLETAETALVTMPNGMSPALLVERFDIRQSPRDKTKIALEDFCSILDLTSDEKYDGTLERAARALRAISTDPKKDIETLLKRAIFAWLVADGDMHLKNLSVLKKVNESDTNFAEVRMSPVYDALTTRVFQGLENDNMAIMVNGKKANIKRADFKAAAVIFGMQVKECESILDDVSAKLEIALSASNSRNSTSLPKSFIAIDHKMKSIIEKRLAEF